MTSLTNPSDDFQAILDIQAVKTKRLNLREKLEKRKKDRQLALGANSGTSSPCTIDLNNDDKKMHATIKTENDFDPEIEKCLIQTFADRNLLLPINSKQLIEKVEKLIFKSLSINSVDFFLKKLALQRVISLKDVIINNDSGYEVILVEHSLLCNEINVDDMEECKTEINIKRKLETDSSDGYGSPIPKQLYDKKNTTKETVCQNTTDIMSLLSMPSTREKQSKQVGEEILELLSKPTAKERSLAEKFKSQGGAQVMEFCPYGTTHECLKAQAHEEIQIEKTIEISVNITDNVMELPIAENPKPIFIVDKIKNKCIKLHFKKIIQSHTDESLGDCSFLNTCFHMDTCKYVHYEVDSSKVGINLNQSKADGELVKHVKIAKQTGNDPLYPPQWIQCDLRYLDMTILGKFAVVMADPPWDIHMELPYGTMSDDEMRQLGVPALQDDGLIFLWVTGRAMELGRECLKLWGYERVDELIWVKTNQLQRIIRTGRTGHWLNHGKEHCLVGMKGSPPNLNRGLDCDVIVAEVRATSHKPDEIYGIIERLSPGTRKIELFGRPHNVQPNWITLGNQLDGIRLVDPELISSFQKRYPDGNCMGPSKKVS